MYSPNDLRPHMTGWQERNIAYWDSLAPDYDDLYTLSWSRLENDQVGQELAWIKDIANCRVIDVGCGTGLGYTICRALSGNVQYTGLDISPRMIAQCRQRWPRGSIPGRHNERSGCI